jgi:DNA-binding beta-propeller fold protein YncE
LLYVVNFDLHGPMERSTISIVEVDTMIEIERVPTGIMPHGSRLSVDGTRHYSVSMMSDELVEMDALSFNVSRTLSLSGYGAHQSEDGAPSHDMHQPVQPTWVTTPTAGGKLYATGNAANQIYEVDVDEWRVTRTFETGPGPYNLDVTRDGATLVVTYKKGASVGFWDLVSGRERARADTSRTIPHGVVLTPDGRYAFVTLEGVGSEPGTVEVYDVESGRRLAAVDIGKQAGGIAFWKVEVVSP